MKSLVKAVNARNFSNHRRSWGYAEPGFAVPMTISTILELIFVLVVLMIGFAVFTVPTGQLPVRFGNLDELWGVHSVARLAATEHAISVGDLRLIYALNLLSYSQLSFWMAGLPKEELVILAPFIDRIIEGRGPPLNLPSEYEDWRPATLQRFKNRMIAQGLWPGAGGDPLRADRSAA
jgi:hypothetical protein